MDRIKGREPSVLMTNTLPDLEFVHHNQVFPIWLYKKMSEKHQGGIFEAQLADPPPDNTGYTREDNILDEALVKFQTQYDDQSITKDDIFFYCYGILHHPAFKTKYRNDLSKALPKIPYAPDFWAFSEAGRELSSLHVGYNQLEGHELELCTSLDFNPDFDEHWKFGEKKQQLSKPKDGQDTVELRVNPKLTVAGIPAKALEYIVNGKSALGWLADRYRIHTDKKHNTGIVNDANKLFQDPRDYIKLVRQITEMSLKTIDIINSLPEAFEPSKK